MDEVIVPAPNQSECGFNDPQHYEGCLLSKAMPNAYTSVCLLPYGPQSDCPLAILSLCLYARQHPDENDGEHGFQEVTCAEPRTDARR